MYKLYLLLFIIAITSSLAKAQKIFSEGVIKYDVFTNNADKPNGLYVVTVKSGFTKRELVMNTGFNNVAIYNHKTGTTTSLNIDQENKYALVMSAEEVKEKNKRFEKASFTAIDQKKKLAGYASMASKVIYTNGEQAMFFYTSEMLPPDESFNTMFPGLKGIPLEYELKSATATNIRFVASVVETKSIDLNTFEIPKDYKMVTRQELESMK